MTFVISLFKEGKNFVLHETTLKILSERKDPFLPASFDINLEAIVSLVQIQQISPAK